MGVISHNGLGTFAGMGQNQSGFNPYTPESRALSISRDNPWGTHVTFDSELNDGLSTSVGINNARIREVIKLVGLKPFNRPALFAVFAAFIIVPEQFKLSLEDSTVWNVEGAAIGATYTTEKLAFERRQARRFTEAPEEAIACIGSEYKALLEKMDGNDEHNAIERVATWLELTQLVDMPADFARWQREQFLNPNPKEAS